MRIEHSIDIAAPIERVWDLTMDVESWPDHSPTFTSIERLEDGPLAVGSTARIKQPAQGAKVWTVTALEPRKHFGWAARAMGTQMTAGHHLAESEHGTRNTLSVDIEGRLAPIVGLLIRRPIRKAIEQENAGFKDWAEGAVSDTHSVAAPSA